MRFSITRAALQKGLTASASAVPTRAALPVLSNILIQAEDDAVRLSGTDMSVFVSLGVPAEVEEAGVVALPARQLVEIARVLEDAPVKFSSSGPGGAESGTGVDIACGRGRFTLYGQAPDEFPDFPEIDFGVAWEMSAGELQTLIEKTSFAVSTEDSRPILNGILWQLRAGETVMVATNGHRLAKITQKLNGGGVPTEVDLIIPPKALNQVQKLYPSDAVLQVTRSDNHLAFRSAGREVFTSLIEGPYPNFDQVIPKDNDKVATVNRAALETAVRRVAVMAEDPTRRVRLSFTNGGLNFKVQTPDLGEAEDMLSLDYEGEDIDIGFNATYLLEVLRHMPDDDVRMTFKAPERAATFQPATGEPDYLCLVMPLRILD
ncbi:DNA polymerase III subunit beta [Candidatus Palauibacter sp.]|uniref:DNA polymerase III subunit beta n=1 Tax=Candidatus Palauibacter sp. TaxID=3101350 RepID=UPI003B01081A